MDTDENSAYGIYGGYMISLYDQKGRKTVFFNCPFDDPEDDALKSFDVSETIKSKITDYSITDYVIQKHGDNRFFHGSACRFQGNDGLDGRDT